MPLLKDDRFRGSLVVVVVTLAALFGIEISEVELNDTILNVIEIVAIVGTISGGVIAISRPSAPVQTPSETTDRSLLKTMNIFSTGEYYDAALIEFNRQNGTEYATWTDISDVDLIWHLSRYVLDKKP